MATSLREIAEDAEVSIATVSRVLRSKGPVASETRQRVLDAAVRLRYRPNLLVRGIQTGRTGVIGVMLPLGDPFYGKILEGIHWELVARDHVPLVLESARKVDGVYRGPSELEQIHRMLDRRVDAVIVRPVEDAASDDYLQAVWDRDVPLVAIDRKLPHTHADFVGTDDVTGGRLAAEHLIARGHRVLGQLAGPDFTSTGHDRRVGFEQAAAKAGVRCVTIFGSNFLTSKEEALQLLSGDPQPTGLFAGNDHLALNGLYPAARELGLRIGADVSIIGFADLPIADYAAPSLTTMRQAAAEIGKQAAALVFRRLDGQIERTPQSIELMPTLIERQSVGPATSSTHTKA